MIIEVRTYTIKAGLREQFIALFERRAISEQQAVGIKVFGPLLDAENPNVFLFLRGFPSMEERDRMTSLFYDGPVWKNELEKLAMPMIETYSSVLTETTPGFVTW